MAQGNLSLQWHCWILDHSHARPPISIHPRCNRKRWNYQRVDLPITSPAALLHFCQRYVTNAPRHSEQNILHCQPRNLFTSFLFLKTAISRIQALGNFLSFHLLVHGLETKVEWTIMRNPWRWHTFAKSTYHVRSRRSCFMDEPAWVIHASQEESQAAHDHECRSIILLGRQQSPPRRTRYLIPHFGNPCFAGSSLHRIQKSDHCNDRCHLVPI